MKIERKTSKVPIAEVPSKVPIAEGPSKVPIAEVRRILRGHGAAGTRRRRRKRQRPEKSLFYTILYCDVLDCQPTAKWMRNGKNGGWRWQRFGRKCFCKIL